MSSENPNFDLGQHFLVDEKVIKKFIDECEIKSEDKIIEIGAGTGIITEKILEKKPEKLLAFEIDKNFTSDLEKLKTKNLEIIQSNAIKHSWKGYNKICASIPYYLAEQIILKAIENPEVQKMILICGESFKKILEEKQEKIGIISDLYYQFYPIEKVSKSSFNPAPRVNSWIVKLERKKDFDNQTDEIIAKILNKNGKIKNAILYSLVESGKTKNQAREIVDKMNLKRSLNNSKVINEFSNLSQRELCFLQTSLNKETLDKPVKSITGKFLIILKDKLKNI